MRAINLKFNVKICIVGRDQPGTRMPALGVLGK